MIASPCINICKMNPVSGLCAGCYRTLDEITGWSRASDAERLAILAQVDQRRPNATPPTPPSGNTPASP